MADAVVNIKGTEECQQKEYSAFYRMVNKAAELKPEQQRDIAMMINGYLIRDEAG